MNRHCSLGWVWDAWHGSIGGVILCGAYLLSFCFCEKASVCMHRRMKINQTLLETDRMSHHTYKSWSRRHWHLHHFGIISLKNVAHSQYKWVQDNRTSKSTPSNIQHISTVSCSYILLSVKQIVFRLRITFRLINSL